MAVLPRANHIQILPAPRSSKFSPVSSWQPAKGDGGGGGGGGQGGHGKRIVNSEYRMWNIGSGRLSCTFAEWAGKMPPHKGLGHAVGLQRSRPLCSGYLFPLHGALNSLIPYPQLLYHPTLLGCPYWRFRAFSKLCSSWLQNLLGSDTPILGTKSPFSLYHLSLWLSLPLLDSQLWLLLSPLFMICTPFLFQVPLMALKFLQLPVLHVVLLDSATS